MESVERATTRQRVLQVLSDAGPEGMTMSSLRSSVGGNPGAVRNAVNSLLVKGKITQEVTQEVHGPTRRIRLADGGGR